MNLPRQGEIWIIEFNESEAVLRDPARPSSGTDGRDVGVGLIVAYKAAKVLVELGLVAGLMVLAAKGDHGLVSELARIARMHVASWWSVEASRGLRMLASQHRLHLLEAGLSLDALLTALEGWSLWKRYRWGAWLVISATLLPLPWEIWEIARRGSWMRVAIAVANLVVAGYLAWRIIRDRRTGVRSELASG